MDNLDTLLKRIEKNYFEKDKKETVDFHLNGEVYKVLLLNRSEKRDLLFSEGATLNKISEIYEWLKPVIYKSFQLKELAIKAKENGYIKTYYEVIDYLFEPEDIKKVIEFVLKINKLDVFKAEEIEFEKK